MRTRAVNYSSGAKQQEKGKQNSFIRWIYVFGGAVFILKLPFHCPDKNRTTGLRSPSRLGQTWVTTRYNFMIFLENVPVLGVCVGSDNQLLPHQI